ncbi:MAG TPA: hypothetical protein VFW63_00340 [Acidimicrobiales bacterium]|nr:hypothetical protein [Acidimicrobiales bacterium]
MDVSKLTTGDRVIVASGLVLLVASFLDWFTVSFEGNGLLGDVSASGNGWDVGFFWAGIPVLLGLAMIAVVAVRALSPGNGLPDLPVSWGQALFVAGVVAAAIVVLKLLVGEDVDGAEAFGVDVDRAFGLFLAALAALGLAVGGFLDWQEERSSGAAGGSLGGTPPPSAASPPPGGYPPPPPPSSYPPPPPPAPGDGTPPPSPSDPRPDGDPGA